MANFADLLKKIAANVRLTPQELDELGRFGTETQQRNAFVAGNTTPQNALNVVFPFAPIYSEIFENDKASVTIPIPENYNNLMIVGNGRTTKSDYYEDIALRFNGDTGANYDRQNIFGLNTLAAASQFTGQTSVFIGTFCAASATALARGSFIAFATNVKSTSWKPIQTLRSARYLSPTNMYASYTGSYWEGSTPVNSITIFPADGNNFLATTALSVYGIV